MDALQFPIENLEETRSRRSYNCYRVSYPSLYSPSLELKTQLVIETYIALLPFPTVQRMTDNYIYRFLKLTDQINLAEEFNLMPFEITTQAIERTLVHKVFAICDYYMTGKTERHSRHLYDIYKILEYISIVQTDTGSPKTSGATVYLSFSKARYMYQSHFNRNSWKCCISNRLWNHYRKITFYICSIWNRYWRNKQNNWTGLF